MMEWWLNASFVELHEYVAIARVAEEAGFAGIALSDHLVTPQTITSPYPYSPNGTIRWNPTSAWPDAWVAIAAMAAVTERLKFTTAVYVAPLRDPISLAKSIGTASIFAPNRLLCGFGVGWMKEEFDLLKAPFEHRGPRFDEMIEVMRLLWSGKMVEFHGKFYDFPPIQMSPPAAGHIPILTGGHTAPALRRAARNDGWIGVHKKLDETRDLIATLNELRKAESRHTQRYTIMMSVIGKNAIETASALADIGVDVAITPILALDSGPDLNPRLDGIRKLGRELRLTA